MGNTIDLSQLTKVPIPNNFGRIENMGCGYNHTIIVNSKNELYACGYNGYGGLGLGHYNNVHSFTKISSNPFEEPAQIKENLIILPSNNCTFLYHKEKKSLYVTGGNEDG